MELAGLEPATLLGANTPQRHSLALLRLVQALSGAVSSVSFSQFGSTVSRSAGQVDFECDAPSWAADPATLLCAAVPHIESQLNELGADGWQVVGVTTKKQLFIAPPQAIILMRELQPTVAKAA
jgi:hypothetical protein